MKIFERIIKFSLYLIIFLLPLFFLPFSFEAFEFNKIFLLYFFVSISIIFYLLKIVFEKEFSFKKNPLNLLVLIFLFFCILSAIFSVDRIFSLFGFYGRFSDSLFLLIFLILFFFLILQNFEEKDISKIVFLFLLSCFFAIFISFFSISGVFQRIQKLPPLMRVRHFNLVSASLEGFSIFLVPVIFLSSSLLILKDSILKKLFYFLILVFSFSLLVIANFKPAFILLILSFSIFLISSLISKIFRKEINKLLLSIFLILISILFLFFNPFVLQSLKPLKENILSQKISWQISLNSATESIKSGFLGSGISTFFYDFSKFKPAEFNKTPLWLVRFDRAGNHLAEILATTGFLGFFSYLILVGVFFLISFLLLSEKPEIFPYVFTLLAIFLAQIFYYQNIVLAFSFWLFFGISVLSWEKPVSKKVFEFKKIPELSLLFNTFLILFSILIFISYYFGYKIYRADFYYLKSLKSWQIPERISFLEKSVKLNPKSSRYKIDLSNSYLTQALNEIQKPAEARDQRLILDSMAKAINFAKGLKNEIEIKGATEISPNWVLVWENLARIYREIIPFVENPQIALEHGIKSFEKAIKLEGKNPILHTELGKLYLLKGEIEKAESEFKKAVELKEDYLDGKIQLALIFERKGDFDQAIKKMEEIVKNFPFNVEAHFQLGRLYFNRDRIDEAILQFEMAISIMPNHSNSLYSLGIAYERKGEKEKALEYFQKVLELNPGNPEVLRKIEELK